MKKLFDHKNRKGNRWRKKITSVLAAVVVFIVAYALILPAITLDYNSASGEPGIVLDQEPSADADTVEADTAVLTDSPETSEAVQTTDDERTAAETLTSETESTEEAASVTGQTPESISVEESVSMPACTLEEKTGDTKDDVTVHVEAEEGTFPEGTTMKLTLIDDQKTIQDITDTFEDGVNVTSIQAVDIAFLDKDGNEIEPLRQIRVTMTSNLVRDTEEPVIVHVDDKGKTEIIEQLDEKKQKELEIVPEEDQVVFEAEKFSVYAIVGTETMTVQYVTAKGDAYEITVSGDLPVGAELHVTPMDDEALVAVIEQLGYSYTHTFFAYDISILDAEGNEWKPEEHGATVQVRQLHLEEPDTEGIQVIHILDDPDAIDNCENAKILSGDKITEQFPEASTAAEESVGTSGIVCTETLEANVTTDEITFDTESFSYYIILTSDQSMDKLKIGEYTINGSGILGSSNHKWTCSDTSVASISANGSNCTLTALKPGKVTITHTYYNFGSRSETFTFTIVEDTDINGTDAIGSSYDFEGFSDKQHVNVIVKVDGEIVSGALVEMQVIDWNLIDNNKQVGAASTGSGTSTAHNDQSTPTGAWFHGINGSAGGAIQASVSYVDPQTGKTVSRVAVTSSNTTAYVYQINHSTNRWSGGLWRNGYTFNTSQIAYASLSTLCYELTVNLTSEDNYSLIYNANGGSFDNGASTIKTVGPQSTMQFKVGYRTDNTTEIGEPVREGYNFLGWNANKTEADQGIARYQKGDTYDIAWQSSATLYAVWSKVQTYDVNFVIDPEGSGYFEGNTSYTVPDRTTIGSDLYPTPVGNDGWHFDHWSDTAVNVNGADVTVTAYMARNTVTVTKNIAAGEGLQTSDIDHTVYFALQNKETGEFLKDADEHIIYKSITITDGEADPAQVVFGAADELVPMAQYNVWECRSANPDQVESIQVRQTEFRNSENKILTVSEISGSNDAVVDNDGEASVTLTNTYSLKGELISISINKKWADGNGNEISAPEGATATLGLFKISNSDNTPVDDPIATITLDGTVDENGENTAWKAVFADIQVEEGYSYAVREISCTPDVYQAYRSKDASSPAGDNDFFTDNNTIWNKRKTTPVTVNKIMTNPFVGEDEVVPFSFTYKLDDGSEIPFTINAAHAEGAAEGEKTGTITLENIPVGAVMVITETADPKYEYTTSAGGALPDAGEGTGGDPVAASITDEDQNDSSFTFNVTEAGGTITFTNTVVSVTNVSAVKTDDKTNEPLSKAQFTLMRNTRTDGTGAYEVFKSITTEDDGMLIATTESLPVGYYMLREDVPAPGYIVTNKDTEFKVSKDSDDNAKIELIGDPVNPKASLDDENKDLTITNEAGAELPSTGGSGTLPYTLGGIALIMASALMYGFRMRRRERRLN